ncbi:MAG: DUF4494 domain-containing protein [Muribaculaceae bacterium]|nr:DUF4494 domain-containing protein [Muribaculaceae bacterium]
MTTWIEVRARYDKMMENGVVKKIVEPYLVDALSCTEAEARVTEELTPFISGDFRISSVVTTKIAEIFWDETGDKFYKVKVNFITLDEKTATEKRNATYILVQASSFKDAYDNFVAGMKGTMADYEIEQICETKIVDVYKADLTPEQQAERTLRDPEVKKHVKKFVDACAEDGVESVTMTASDGKTVQSTTIEIPQKPKPNHPSSQGDALPLNNQKIAKNGQEEA